MTDKQIIIDGIDVSGCEFHSSTPCSELCYMKGNKCNDNPNCYFKQLARKTHECDELSKNSIGFAKKCQKLELEIFHLKDKNNVLTRQLDQLKATKEQAEQKLERIRDCATALCYTVMSDGVITLQKDILKIIDEVENE